MGVIGLWHKADKDPIAATKIGYAYSEQLNDYNKALEWYKYSNSMKPLPENSNYACYALQQLKQYNEAIQWCQDAIKLGSDEALFRLGKVLELKKEFTKAIDFYKQAYEKNKKDTMALNNIGSCYYELKQYNEAEKYYKQAIQEGNLTTYQNIATFYHEGLQDDIKASAYAIAVINTKYTKSSVLRLLQDEWEIPNDIIKKGYELQLNSKEFPVKFDGDLDLE